MKNEEKRAKKLNDARFTLISKLSYFRVKNTVYNIQMSSAKDRKMIKAIIRKL